MRNPTERRKYDITQCTLYKCRTKKRLAEKLMIDYSELRTLCSTARDSYYSFTRDKKDGDKRVITSPKQKLKRVQKRVLRLLQDIQRPDWLISGERGKSYITNGQIHLNSDYLLTMDIKKFYDNCKRDPVFKFFTDTLKTSSDVASILTDIVTFDDGIPTGCPTSQMIAYYAYQEMFLQINEISLAHNCVFTLYVDDITFSSNVPFDPNVLARIVANELKRFGHRLKWPKVKYYSKGSHKLVTGVVISPNHVLLVPNALRRKIYIGAMQLKKHMVKRNGIEDLEFLKASRSLQGRVQSAQSVQNGIFREIKRLAVRATEMA